MKKLMIIAAVAMAAVAANASVVKWQVGNVRIPVAQNLAIDESGIVTTTDSAKFDTGALTVFLSYENASGNLVDITSKATTGAGAISSSTAMTEEQALAVLTAAGSDTVTFHIGATYADPSGKGTYVYDGTLDKNIYDAAHGISDANLVFNMNTAGSWDYTAATVPEPTSGLLLLLGMAGLALRRRRA